MYHLSHRVVCWAGRLAALALILVSAAAPAQERLMSRQFTNGTAVRGAFRQVVSEAGRSVVRIKAGDKNVALGTIVSTDGYLLTKASELSDDLVCRLRDGSEHPARLVGVHEDTDLALLKIEAEELPAIRWSDEAAPAVGRWLATVGVGDLPVAVGVVSVPAREIPAERGILGIAVSDEDEGAKITRIFPNSGADKAGLKVGDLLLDVGGRVVRNGDELTASLRAFRPGESLSVRVRRGEDEVRCRCTLGDAFSSLLDRSSVQNRMGGELSLRRNGFPAALQHDTVLRPQDCGGVVVDLSGRAVGVNIARAGRTETFTLPAATVLSLVGDLMAGKYPPPTANDPQVAEAPTVPQSAAE